MAKREDSKSQKTPKYFSASDKQMTKGRKLIIDVPEGAPIPPKDSKTGLVRKSSEDALLVYRQLLQVGKSTSKVGRTVKAETPKGRPKPIRTGLNSPKGLETLFTGHSSSEDPHRGHKKSSTPKVQKKSAVPSTGSFTPKGTTRSRPLTASGSYTPAVPTPKTRTPRQQSHGLSQSARAGGLKGLVTQVKSSMPAASKDLTEEQVKARSEAIYHEHLFQTFQALKFVKILPQPEPEQIAAKRVVLSRRPGYEQKKTLVFDLDETLVHCCEDPGTMGADVYLPVVFPTGEMVQVMGSVGRHQYPSIRT